MMDSEQKRAFIAVALSGLILFGWQYFYGNKNSGPVETKIPIEVQTQTQERVSPQTISAEQEKTASVAVPVLPIEMFEAGNEKAGISFNNNLAIISLKSDRSKYDFSRIVESDEPLVIKVVDNNVEKLANFAVKADPQGGYEGIDNNLGISLKLVKNTNGLYKVNLYSTKSYDYVFIFKSKVGKLNGRFDHDRNFIFNAEEDKRFSVSDSADDNKNGEGNINWFGIDFDYHLFAVVMDKKEMFKYDVNTNVLTLKTIGGKTSLSFDLVYTIKEYDYLSKLGNNLELAVNFGLLGILAVPLLKTLNFFYKYIPNYGVVIIVTTLLLRMLLYPLQHKSYKSMNKMKKIQPEMNKLKEKFKDDPQRMQKETMELFKREGANPMSGCLPLIAQLPIFFAFYRVLNSSVEMVNTPFYFWITDLSSKDHYYVLPVLLMIIMFVQQKYLTPATSVDPTQQKIMLFMPLIFGFIMKDLASGLVLYIFVSTIFGVAQQLVVNKYFSS